MRSFPFSLFLIICLTGLSLGDNQFTEPDGRLNDREQTYTVGDTMNIKWVAGWIGSDEQPEFVDLFITWFGSDSYSELLLANTTTKQAGFFPWKINVTAEVVNADDAFVLRFRPHRDPKDYNNGGPMAPSRGFLLQLASSASSSSVSTPVTSSITSTLSVPSSTSVTTTAPPTPTVSATSEGGKSSTNVGAIVGGVVGGIAVIVLIIIAVLLFRIWKRRKSQEAATSNDMSFAGYVPQISEAEGTKYSGIAAAELDGNQMPVEASIGAATAR